MNDIRNGGADGRSRRGLLPATITNLNDIRNAVATQPTVEARSPATITNLNDIRNPPSTRGLELAALLQPSPI